MKFVFLFLSFGAAFVLETFFAGVVGRFEIVPPLVIIVIVVGFFLLNFPERLWASVIFGFLGDAVFSFSFGTYLIVFLLLAVLVEVFNRIFLGSGYRNYYLTRAPAVSIMIFIVLNMVNPLSFFLAWVRTGYGAWYAFRPDLFNVLVYSILWSMVIAAVTVIPAFYFIKARETAGTFRL